jgi:hypothetical protein
LVTAAKRELNVTVLQMQFCDLLMDGTMNNTTIGSHQLMFSLISAEAGGLTAQAAEFQSIALFQAPKL